jgi:hypothetical protein
MVTSILFKSFDNRLGQVVILCGRQLERGPGAKQNVVHPATRSVWAILGLPIAAARLQ